MSNIIQSLWIGSKLSKMEQLSIKSFMDNGHEYHLYIYDNVENVPEGTIIKDANEILPKSEIYTYRNGSYSAFSNYFRFTMMYKKGGYWADTDMICVKPFKFDQEIVITSEPDDSYSLNVITSSLIKLPQNSKEALEGINIQKRHKSLIISGQLNWSSGPQTVQSIVDIHKLHKYVLSYRGICSCSYKHTRSIVDPRFKPNLKIITSINNIPENMICIHLWNEVWRREGINKDSKHHPDSLYEQLKRKYNI